MGKIKQMEPWPSWLTAIVLRKIKILREPYKNSRSVLCLSVQTSLFLLNIQEFIPLVIGLGEQDALRDVNLPPFARGDAVPEHHVRPP